MHLDYIRVNKLLRKPLYHQIADSIATAYENNVLKHGDLLPTEKEICDSFNVSTSVVKGAYNDLIARGLVTREMGRGTFIAEDLVIAIDIEEAFSLFLDYDKLYRNVTYIEHMTNTHQSLYPKGPLRVVFEVIYRKKKAVALRKLYVHLDYIDLFLKEGWDFNQRIFINMKSFDAVESYLQVVNIKSKEARFLNLEPDTASFYQPVKFYKDQNWVAVLENYYPSHNFIWEQTIEPIQFR